MTTAASLREKRELIDRSLADYLPEGDSKLAEAMRYAVLSGGKRFRPLLTLASGECFGVGSRDTLPFACAIELIHNYSLVHDDLPALDDDELRRGQPTCHAAFGEDIALLTGDALLTLAFEIMARAPVGDRSFPARAEIMADVARLSGAGGMIGGQLLDISLPPAEISREELDTLILLKTGGLITASVRIGAALGGAGGDEMDAITRYGENLGLAFQTRDDILDAREDSHEAGTPRPNSVVLYGEEEAARRLNRFVDGALTALNDTGRKSEELRFLAEFLLVRDEG